MPRATAHAELTAASRTRPSLLHGREVLQGREQRVRVLRSAHGPSRLTISSATARRHSSSSSLASANGTSSLRVRSGPSRAARWWSGAGWSSSGAARSRSTFCCFENTRSGRRGGNAAWASMGSARVSRPDRASGALREAKREKHRRRTENGRRLGRVSARVPRRPARRGTTRSARGTSRVRAARDRGVTTRVVSAATQITARDQCGIFASAVFKADGFARPWTPETARRRRRGRPRVLARLSNTHLELIDQHRDVEQVESSDAMVPAANGCTCDSKCAK